MWDRISFLEFFECRRPKYLAVSKLPLKLFTFLVQNEMPLRIFADLKNAALLTCGWWQCKFTISARCPFSGADPSWHFSGEMTGMPLAGLIYSKSESRRRGRLQRPTNSFRRRRPPSERSRTPPPPERAICSGGTARTPPAGRASSSLASRVVSPCCCRLQPRARGRVRGASERRPARELFDQLTCWPAGKESKNPTSPGSL